MYPYSLLSYNIEINKTTSTVFTDNLFSICRFRSTSARVIQRPLLVLRLSLVQI